MALALSVIACRVVQDGAMAQPGDPERMADIFETYAKALREGRAVVSFPEQHANVTKN